MDPRSEFMSLFFPLSGLEIARRAYTSTPANADGAIQLPLSRPPSLCIISIINKMLTITISFGVYYELGPVLRVIWGIKKKKSLSRLHPKPTTYDSQGGGGGRQRQF